VEAASAVPKASPSGIARPRHAALTNTLLQQPADVLREQGRAERGRPSRLR